MARPISATPCPMLTTAAWPDASRRRRPSDVKIHDPSPRITIGKSFLKFLGNRADGLVMSRTNCNACNGRARHAVRICYACAIFANASEEQWQKTRAPKEVPQL